MYWLFLIPAIILALFSDEIDKASNANKKLKELLIGSAIIVVIVSIQLIVQSIKII